MQKRGGRLVLVTMFVLLLSAGFSAADTPDVEGDQDAPLENPDVVIEDESIEDGDSDTGPTDDVSDSNPNEEATPSMEYAWLPACSFNDPDSAAPNLTCPGMYTCPSITETKWMLWGRELPDGEWYPIETACYSGPPPSVGGGIIEPRPQVTDAIVLREVKRIGLPSVDIDIQPVGGATLVNFDTIFYTQPPEFTRTVQLLGYSVDIEADATKYTWHHGDGTTQTTRGPGAPYPAKDVIHQYTDAHVTVNPSVDVTYEVRWRVGDAEWHTIGELLTATGDSTALTIKEGTPVLNDPYT